MNEWEGEECHHRLTTRPEEFSTRLVLFRVDGIVKKEGMEKENEKTKKSGGRPVKIQSHHDIGIIAPPAGLAQRDAIGFFIALSIGIVNRHVPSQGREATAAAPLLTVITAYTGADETLASLIWPATAAASHSFAC